MSESIVIQLITTAGLIIVAIIGNRKLNRIGEDARTSATQTANEHHDAPYPNLRDELTAVREGQDEIRASVSRVSDAQSATRDEIGGLHSEVRDARDDISGLRTDARRDRREIGAVRKSLDQAVEDRDEQILALRNDIPDLIAVAVTDHVDACPLRNPTTTPIGGTR